jgi:anti-anti-sigma factor
MSIPPKITPETRGDICIIHMAGEVDAISLPQLESAAKPMLGNANIKNFVLDFKELLFIDSKVVGYMAYLYTTLTRSRRKLIFSGANGAVNDILTLVGLTGAVQTFATDDEAINQLAISNA